MGDRRALPSVLVAAALLGAGGSAALAALPVVDPTVPAKRDTEAVVLTGRDFGRHWSAPSNVTAKAPLTDIAEDGCLTFDARCRHNDYAEPEVDSQRIAPFEGTPVDQLLGYRWIRGGHGVKPHWQQIPFQVDEVFTRYLDNSASGFAVYSGEDQHTTYAFDREGFRWYDQDPSNPCVAKPASPVAKDPVRGLDDNDELSFMASDAGPKAPARRRLPDGIADAKVVVVRDPLNRSAPRRYVYVMRALASGPKPAFDASNGYVRYARDWNADFYEKSESNYSGYGNARTGVVCDASGNPILDSNGNPVIARRRPRDYATVTTPRYRFRYDGRWLLTELGVSPSDDWSYGPDLIDRWKARAFAQDPSSKTPCCGYEDEDQNWGGSSTLLGERVGPVRAIRETWGADSGTNVVRRETFYRDEVRMKSWLRVHPIPPLDGIYAQWDFNAGRVTTYYNPRHQEGVPVDGKNDEVFGNLDDPCNANYDSNPNDVSPLDSTYRQLYSQTLLCDQRWPYHQSIDVADPTLSDVNAGLSWSETTGPYGTVVDRYQIDKVTDLTPGGTPQTLFAVPYYRDDSCFDDGTGSDPGVRLIPRSANEPRTYTAPDGTQQPRKCWDSSSSSGDPAVPGGDPRFFQGDIGTHGLHLLLLLDTDNARATVPVDELVSEQRLVVLPGERGPQAGEEYGRQFEKPLVTTVHPARQRAHR